MRGADFQKVVLLKLNVNVVFVVRLAVSNFDDRAQRFIVFPLFQRLVDVAVNFTTIGFHDVNAFFAADEFRTLIFTAADFVAESVMIADDNIGRRFAWAEADATAHRIHRNVTRWRTIFPTLKVGGNNLLTWNWFASILPSPYGQAFAFAVISICGDSMMQAMWALFKGSAPNGDGQIQFAREAGRFRVLCTNAEKLPVVA